jgi:deoxyribose-phosphate aldolase
VRESIQNYINNATEVALNSERIQQILTLIDLTSLGDDDTPDKITILCKKAITPHGAVAAVCVYPHFLVQVATTLHGQPLKIATVINFPHGVDPIDKVQHEIKSALQAGANEIDVVFPYRRYLAGDKMGAQDFIRQCRYTCGDAVTLKVILETGAIPTLDLVSDISHDVILAGADFLKTSTGKIPIGATLEAAAMMLLAIKGLQPSTKRKLGFKASGGVRTLEQATSYIELANQIMGAEWVSPQTFRLGASQLLDVALQTL